MKKIKQIGKIGLLTLLLTFASCSSDSAGNPNGGPDGGIIGGLAAEGTIKGDADGRTIITDKINTSGTIMGVGTFRKLQVLGSFSSTGEAGALIAEAFGVTVSGYTGVGTYNVNTGEGSNAILSLNRIITNTGQETNFDLWSAGKIHAGTTGTVTITQASSTKVVGTFSFKGLGNNGVFKEITNGSFNVAVTDYNN